jgi:hypothetical protein
MQPLRHTIDWSGQLLRREELAAWTAPSGATCGQLCALYEAEKNGGRGAWIAIGRLVSDAVMADEGDQRTWAYVQWRQVRNEVPYAVAREKGGVGAVQGSYGSMSDAQWHALSGLLVADDPTSKKVLSDWEHGRGFPTSNRVPYRLLRQATLDPVPHERDLYPIVGEALEARGWRSLAEPLDRLVRGLRGGTPSDPSAQRRRVPDVRLCRPRSRRLLLVEVKWAAIPSVGDYNPVDQVVSYARAARKALARAGVRKWSVEPMLVAEDFMPDVLSQAEHADVSCLRLVDRRLVAPDNGAI